MPRTTSAAAGALAGIAALHVVWSTGSPWPLTGHAELADAVGGRAAGADPPSPAECLAVAGLLTTAATLVAGHPARSPKLRRAGAAGVVAVLSARGALGLAGRTDLAVPGATSPRFRRLDRRVYAPLCLALAAASAPATRL
jgi:hypothetical protein